MKRKTGGSFLRVGGSCLLMMSVLIAGYPALADTSVPFIFFLDTPEKAEEVNKNFETLSDAIDANTAAIMTVSPDSLFCTSSITIEDHQC